MSPIFLGCVVAAALAGAGGPLTAPTRGERELHLADRTILWAMIASRSEAGRKACAESPFACGADRLDLGLALIARHGTDAARQELIAVLRFRIDGGASEDLTCHILAGGQRMVKALRAASPGALAARCIAELRKVRVENPTLVAGATEESVCATEGDIVMRLKSLLDAVLKGKRCPAEDF